MASGQSSSAVLAAIVGNVGITVSKFVAAGFSGSAGMLAEAIHSLVDTGNSALLYVGQRRSARPADEDHPFGHGMELYFWTLLVALVMFAVGGVVTVGEGVRRLLDPEPLEGLGWSYAVLALSAGFNGYTWWAAVREFWAGKAPGDSVWQAVRKVKDPTVLAVLSEDSASLIGLAVAFLGLFLGDRLGEPRLDGAASVIIGLLLGAVAVGLVMQCKTLLLGESTNREVQDRIRTLVEGDAAVAEVLDLLTMHLGPQDVLLNLKVRFRDGLQTRDLGGAIDRLEQAIRGRHPEVRRIFIEPGPPADGPARHPGVPRQFGHHVQDVPARDRRG